MFADICNPLTVDIDDNPDSCLSDVYTRLANYSATNTNHFFGVRKHPLFLMATLRLTTF